ncbi:MAG TPA: guanylate kinase [Mycobacteriales bacterium]|nr:guanylate kinase [Mycobacteriales bacterium]
MLAGPSGVGKGTVVAEIRRRYPEVWVSVSVTTRAPRPGETAGVEYRFVDDAEFARLVAAGELLEHDAHFGASYGTPRAPVAQRLAAGVPVLLEIDINGARQVRAADPAALLVFLAPPSFEELARRLTGRGTEDPERRRSRLDRARMELATEDEFDVVVVNDTVESAAERVVSLMITPPRRRA